MAYCSKCGSASSGPQCPLCGTPTAQAPGTASAPSPHVIAQPLPPSSRTPLPMVSGEPPARATVPTTARTSSVPVSRVMWGVLGVAVAAIMVGTWMASQGSRGAPAPTIAAPAATRAQQTEPKASSVTSAGVRSITGSASSAGLTPSPAIASTQSYPLVTVPSGSKECQRTGTGPFAAAGTANETTSCPFAINVREAYLAAGLNGTAGQIRAYSPTTKLWYDLECAGAQPALCTGGRAGRVIIYGGRLVHAG